MKGLFDYQLRVLNQDRGKIFIPMRFYKEESDGCMKTNIRYDFSGMISLNEWLQRGTQNLSEVLDVFENIFLLLDRFKEILIDFEELEISGQTVFVSMDQSNEIKVQFLLKEDVRLQTDFGFFLKEASENADGYAKEYLEMMAKRVDVEKPGLPGIINMVGKIKREVYICGWIGKSRAV